MARRTPYPLPEGWRIEREERNMDGFMAPEVTFCVFEPGGQELTTARAREDRRRGEWVVIEGRSMSWYDKDDARAKAIVLLMAADEVEKRNEEAKSG